MHISFFLAWRYLRSSITTPIKTMLLISFITIASASCALALVCFIMQGFEQSTHQALKGLHADLTMQSKNNFIDFAQVKKVLDQEFTEIIAASPSDMQQGLVRSIIHDDQPHAVMIKAVDPLLEAQTTILPTMIRDSKKEFSQLFWQNRMILGYKLAKLLRIKPGDSLELLLPSEQQLKRNSVHFTTHKIVISALFKTGIEELDTNLIVCSFSTLEQLMPESGVSMIHLNHKKNIDEQNLIHKLKQRFGFMVYSWKQLYPALIAALSLEKYSMIMIMSIMVFLASMSIIALLFMIITVKQKDQAILRAMGLSKNKCNLIFMIIGLLISSIASVCGLTIAYIIGKLLQNYPLIKLPDAYYVSHLPIVMHGYNFVAIFLLIFFISFLITLIPFLQNRNIQITSLLKSEL